VDWKVPSNEAPWGVELVAVGNGTCCVNDAGRIRVLRRLAVQQDGGSPRGRSDKNSTDNFDRPENE